MSARANRRRKARARKRMAARPWRDRALRRAWRQVLVADAGMGRTTPEDAADAAERRLFESCPAIYVARFQLREEVLCMPFGFFQKCVERATGEMLTGYGMAACRKSLLRQLGPA